MMMDDMLLDEAISIFSVLIRSAEQWPDRPAIIDEFGALDYQTLLEETEKTARIMKSYGLRQGDGVGVQARNGRGFIIVVFAAVRCGATVLPIAHTLMTGERNEILDRTPVHVVIIDRDCQSEFETPGKEIPVTDIPPFYYYTTNRPSNDRIVDLVPDAAFVRYTSGTTGLAKGVVLSHQGVYERITAANRGLKLTEKDVVLFVLPMAFHFYVSIILYLHAGAAIVIAGDHSPLALVDLISRHAVTLFYASPYHYRMLVAARMDKARLKTLKRAISTSTGLSHEIAERFYSTYGIAITQAYGIIEIGLPIINLRHNEQRPLSIGQPLPDYEVAILDDDGATVEPGVVGHLAMRGPGMFSAYLDPFNNRDEVLVNGWFMTGDMALEEGDGSMTVRGRKKSMINVCGEKVFPEEVENVLNQHNQVAESFVYGMDHPRMGETVHAQVVLSGDIAPDKEELIGFARTRLSPFKIPQQIFYVDQIEKTSSGKTFRRGG